MKIIEDLTQRASSRKFLVLVVSVCLHLKDPTGFTGDNMVWVLGVYMGVNVVQKFIDKMK